MKAVDLISKLASFRLSAKMFFSSDDLAWVISRISEDYEIIAADESETVYDLIEKLSTFGLDKNITVRHNGYFYEIDDLRFMKADELNGEGQVVVKFTQRRLSLR